MNQNDQHNSKYDYKSHLLCNENKYKQIPNIKQESQKLKEIVIVERDKNGKFPLDLPNSLNSVFSAQEYSYLINKINKYKPPSQSFYIALMVFQLLIFIATILLSFYLLTVGNKLYGLGFLLLFLSVLSLIGSLVAYFKKTNDYVDNMEDYYRKLTNNYTIKSIKFYGHFKKIGGESFYKIINNQLFIEFPKSNCLNYQQDGAVFNEPVKLYNINNYGTFKNNTENENDML